MDRSLLEQAAALEPQLIAWRRELHRWPELGFCEMRTSSRIARVLTELGFDQVLVGRDVCDGAGRMGVPPQAVLDAAYEAAEAHGADPEFLPAARDGFTGVVGVLRCGAGPTVALRFDIDALPLTEFDEPDRVPVREGFRSENPGVMHACGHDGHTAIGLGVATVLAAHRDMLHGTLKLLFQPAEEGVRGAKSLVDKGHLEGVDYVLGAHMAVSPDGELSLGVDSGASLATAKYDAVFLGKTSHAGMAPQDGQNALLAAATAVLNLHAIPRHSGGDTRINVGKLTAGTGRNIVCGRAALELEVRGSTTEACDYMAAYARRILEAAAAMHGCRVEITCVGAAAGGANSPALADLLVETLTEAGIPIRRMEDGAAASEDYAYFTQRVCAQGGQSCYFYNLSRAHGFHHGSFDFDEAALVPGVQAFCAMACRLMRA